MPVSIGGTNPELVSEFTSAYEQLVRFHGAMGNSWFYSASSNEHQCTEEHTLGDEERLEKYEATRTIKYASENCTTACKVKQHLFVPSGADKREEGISSD